MTQIQPSQVSCPTSIMDRASYLRSLPFFHPYSWPTPGSASSADGYVRKRVLHGHVASIEPVSSSGILLGPAFFRSTNDKSNSEISEGDGALPSINTDPALCGFEASFLALKSVVDASPGASSTSTAFNLSQSPNTPSSKKAVSGKLNAALCSETPKENNADVSEPLLCFSFGEQGVFAVDHGKITRVVLELGSIVSELRGAQTVERPPSILICFESCAFRIFRLFSVDEKEDSNKMTKKLEKSKEVQLKYLRTIHREIVATLRTSVPFVVPKHADNLLDGACDEGYSDSPYEGGQVDQLESSNSEQNNNDDENNKGTAKSSEVGSLLASGNGIGAHSMSPRKRRRAAYDQSFEAICSIRNLTGPLRGGSSSSSSGKHISNLMATAANALAVCYDTKEANKSSGGCDEIERIRNCMKETMADFFPVHTRMRHKRSAGGSGFETVGSPNRRQLGPDESTRDANELRVSAKDLMAKYRNVIAARHELAVLPRR